MKRWIQFIFFILSISFFSAYAEQGSSDSLYMWTNSSGLPSVDYDWVDIKNGTLLFGPAFDDTVSAAVPLPFSFEFYGTEYSQIFISSNGWAGFVNPDSNSYPLNDSIPAPGALQKMIAVFWDSLQSTPGNSGGIYYKTLGAAPNRRFVVQWDVRNSSGSPAPGQIVFQLILFEESDLIKFQYNQVDTYYTTASSATIGLQSDSLTGSLYSYNTPSDIQPYSAILFHNKIVGNASAYIVPLEVTVGNFQNFKYTFHQIDTSSAARIGKLDRFAIGNAFSGESIPTVTSIKINNYPAFIQNSTAKPQTPGFATWHYASDSLIIQTADFDVVDSLVINFVQHIPNTPGSGSSFAGSYDAVLDSSRKKEAINDGWSVMLIPAEAYEYLLSPDTARSMSAGDSLHFLVSAKDQFGNPVASTDSILLSAPGGSGISFIPSSRMAFAGEDTLSFYMSATKVDSFLVQVQKKNMPAVKGQTGLVTVFPGAADSLSYESADSLTVPSGATRQLSVSVSDAYLNAVASEPVEFIIRSGGGNLEGQQSLVRQSSQSGIVSVDYTSGSQAGENIITARLVNSPPDSLQFVVRTIPGGISYFQVIPQTTDTTAGSFFGVTVNAYDANNNFLINDDTTAVELLAGGSGVSITPATATLSGGSTQFQVSDTVAEQFTLLARSVSDTIRQGVSPLIRIRPGAADSLIYLSGNDPALPLGASKALRAKVTDSFLNPVPNTEVRFRITAGNGSIAGQDSVTVLSNSEGNVEAEFNTGTFADTVQVEAFIVASPSNRVVFSLTIVAGPVSYYGFQPVDDDTVQAGDTLSFSITAYDSYGNPKPNSGSIRLRAIGSSSAVFSSTILNFSGGASLNFQVSDTTRGQFLIKAENTTNPFLAGQSGIITVMPDYADPRLQLTFPMLQTIVVGHTIPLGARLTDSFGNPLVNQPVTLRRLNPG
ncbi:MAG: hypothetical protein WAN36_10935, partial [Calditrichia bacterium]